MEIKNLINFSLQTFFFRKFYPRYLRNFPGLFKFPLYSCRLFQKLYLSWIKRYSSNKRQKSEIGSVSKVHKMCKKDVHQKEIVIQLWYHWNCLVSQFFSVINVFTETLTHTSSLLYLKLITPKCVTYVPGCSLTESSLTV